MSAAPEIFLQLAAGTPRAGWLTPLAGMRLASDVPLDPACATTAQTTMEWPTSEVPAAGPWREVYDGPGLIQGRQERVISEAGPAGRRIRFEDGESWLVRPLQGAPARSPATAPRAGSAVSIQRAGAETGDPASRLERALGGPLALALARHRIWLLHASAVGGDAGVAALVAPSGGGKSTLASAAAAGHLPGLSRLADDMLPVRLGESPAALPHYPQLKLRAGEGYPRQATAELALRAIVLLEHDSSQGCVEWALLSPVAACLALIQATASARLFDESESEAHLADCAKAAEVLPIGRLRFRSGDSGLSPALAAVAALLS